VITGTEVLNLVAKQMAIPLKGIRSSDSLKEDLDMDSLDIVELVLAIEEKYKVTISDEAIDSIYSVRDLICFLKGKTDGN